MMDLSFKIRQAKPFRTRIQYPALRHKPACCQHIETLLAPLDGVVGVEVRPETGSIILVHPNQPIKIRTISTLVQDQHPVLQKLRSAKPLQKARALQGAACPEQADKTFHVSGATLIISGLYMGWLMVKRVLAPVAPAASLLARVVTIPGLLALWLAIPIQRQAIENYKTTGRIDMSFVSTGLLAVSLFTGNIMTALAVAWLYNLSGWTESRIKRHTRRLVRDMLTGQQTHAWKLVDGVEVQVNTLDLVPGDIIVLGNGNAIPVDGTVIQGTALVNASAMTGESLPLEKTDGQTVLAGTFVEDGSIHVRVDKTGEDTRMAAIVRLIESAQTDLGERGRASLKFSQVMVPVSLTLAAGVFLMTGSLFMAITTIMVTCPCALRLSTSAAVSSAMGAAAAKGILIKGGSQVEIAGKVDTLVLDKTGTLTDSVSHVTDIRRLDRRYKENTILGLAAATLQPWNHPLSRAVARAAHERDIALPPCEDRNLFVGRGVEAKIKGKTGSRTIIAGSRRFMVERGVEPSNLASSEVMQGGDGIPESVVFVAAENHLIGCIHAGHVIRGDAQAATMERLRTLGVSHIAMLTGDTREGAMPLVAHLDFDESKWGMSPEDKAAWVDARRNNFPGEVIAVVGDGINDTPAFSKSDLSFAVGEAGEDLTLAYADIVLQKGGIGAVADTLYLGRDTLARLKGSYAMAIGLNLLTLGFMITGIFSPLVGALAHNMITLAAVSNAARITAH